MGRRHSSTGGDDDQSVLTRRSGTTPSRCRPRTPGQLLASTSTTRGCAAGSVGRSLAAASSRSSGVGVHRQATSKPAVPVIPPVRTRLQPQRTPPVGSRAASEPSCREARSREMTKSSRSEAIWVGDAVVAGGPGRFRAGMPINCVQRHARPHQPHDKRAAT